jgi:hypothetical protein
VTTKSYRKGKAETGINGKSKWKSGLTCMRNHPKNPFTVLATKNPENSY